MDTISNPDVPMIVRESRPNGFLRVNRIFTEQLGFADEDLVDLSLLDWIHVDDRPSFQKLLDLGEGTLQARHRSRKNDWTVFDWQVRTEEAGPVALGLMHINNQAEFTHPKKTPRESRGLIGEVLESMALIFEKQHPGLKCSVLLLDEERCSVLVGAGPSLPEEYNQAIEGLRIGPTVGSCGTASYWNTRVIVEDIQNDPLWVNLREYAVKAGLAACWSQPILSSEGVVLGATALYSAEPRTPTKHELVQLETSARMFGLAIERTHAESALRELEAQLRQAAKMEALGVLAGGLAHDFNNVLATVMGNAELALESITKTDPTRPMLNEIITASRSAAEICNQMLAYVGRGVLSIQHLECNRLIEEFGGLLQVTLSKKATLIYELSDDPQFLEADKTQLGQVLMNLITNAAEALGNETGQIRITTETVQLDASTLRKLNPRSDLNAGEYVRLTVHDNGIGMTQEVQAKIFDPFFTTKFSGRGLGLAAVQGIVLRHHGWIGLKSEPGEGTTFTLLFPRMEPPNELSESPVETVIQQQIGKRVLVVDDEPLVRNVMQRILEGAGFEVLLAENGREAIDIYRKEKDAIDCVLLDLSMPELDGEETFSALRQIRSDVRVVLSSGFTEQEILNRFRDAGFAGVLQKPTPRKALIAKINQAIS